MTRLLATLLAATAAALLWALWHLSGPTHAVTVWVPRDDYATTGV